MSSIVSYTTRVVMLLFLVCTIGMGIHAEDTFAADGFDVELGNTFISNHINHYHSPADQEKQITPDQQHGKKFRSGKHISFQLIFNPASYQASYIFDTDVEHQSSDINQYDYLYFRIINPPPPKCC